MRSKYLSEEYCRMTDGGLCRPYVINVDNSEVDGLQRPYLL